MHQVARPERYTVRHWPASVGLVATLAALVAWEVATRFERPLPGRVLIVPVLLAVVYTSFVGGIRWAVASAVLASVGAFAHELAAEGAAGAQPLVSGGTMAFAFLGTAIVIGTLRSRSDRAARVALQAREDQTRITEARNLSLRRANANLEAFTYVVSHDLKEPVRGLDIMLEALEEDHGAKLDSDGRELLAKCREANDRLARLVEGLLDLSRAARGVFDLGPVSLDRLLESGEGTAALEAVVRERGAVVEVLPAATPSSVVANESALAQVLRNLVLNAIRHNPRESPHVWIRIVPQGDRTAIVVEDDGPGFRPEHLRKLNLESPHASRVTHEGGFGLVIVRRVVDLMGGKVEFGTRQGGGASVRVLLDISRPAEPSTEP